MKHTIAILGVAAVAAVMISACGGDNGQAVMSPAPSTTSQSLDTAQLLAQARETSETNSPYQVNDGALVLIGTSDTAEPISVNGT